MSNVLVTIWNRCCRKAVFWLSYFMLYVFAVFMCFVAYESFGPVRNPILVLESSVQATRRLETVEVSYIRSYNVKFDSEGIIFKYLIHKESGTRIDLSSSYREQPSGERTRKFSHIMPNNIPNGRYSLKTIYFYRPKFSIVERLVEYPDIDFTICDKFESCI